MDPAIIKKDDPYQGGEITASKTIGSEAWEVEECRFPREKSKKAKEVK